MPKKKRARRKKSSRSRAAAKRKAIRKKTVRRKRTPRRKRTVRGKPESVATLAEIDEQGLGSEAAGQSGDIQGLSHQAHADSESVEELAEEGQAFEAEVVSGVEGAPNADEGEVVTREVPEDDVPPEYRDRED